jgi:hypothetical protein
VRGLDESGQVKSSAEITLGDVAYDDSHEWPMEITIPDVNGAGEAMTPATVRITLMQRGRHCFQKLLSNPHRHPRLV